MKQGANLPQDVEKNVDEDDFQEFEIESESEDVGDHEADHEVDVVLDEVKREVVDRDPGEQSSRNSKSKNPAKSKSKLPLEKSVSNPDEEVMIHSCQLCDKKFNNELGLKNA